MGTVKNVLENNNAIVVFKNCVLDGPDCKGHEMTHTECFVTGGTLFVIGTQGLNTDFEIWGEDAWQKAESLPANMHWEHVKVASRDHMDAWITAKQRWLEAAWTPNQSDDDRRENAQIMRDAEKRMSELEIS